MLKRAQKSSSLQAYNNALKRLLYPAAFLSNILQTDCLILSSIIVQGIKILGPRGSSLKGGSAARVGKNLAARALVLSLQLVAIMLLYRRGRSFASLVGIQLFVQAYFQIFQISVSQLIAVKSSCRQYLAAAFQIALFQAIFAILIAKII